MQFFPFEQGIISPISIVKSTHFSVVSFHNDGSQEVQSNMISKLLSNTAFLTTLNDVKLPLIYFDLMAATRDISAIRKNKKTKQNI